MVLEINCHLMMSSAISDGKQWSQRVIHIDLDEDTDEEEIRSTGMSSDPLSADIDIDLSVINDNLNQSQSDFNIDLEVFEDFFRDESLRSDLSVISDTQPVDENSVQRIENYLKCDVNDMNCESTQVKTQSSDELFSQLSENECQTNDLKLNKKFESINRQNKRLTQRLKRLKEEVESHRRRQQQLQEKHRSEVEELKDLLRKRQVFREKKIVFCFKCGSVATKESFCCFYGQYCSQECRSSDWPENHSLVCLNPEFAYNLRSKPKIRFH